MATSDVIVEDMIRQKVINLRCRAIEEGMAGRPQIASEYRTEADQLSHMIR